MDWTYLLILPAVIVGGLSLTFLSGRARRGGYDWCGPPPKEPGAGLLDRLWSRLRRRRA